MRNGYRSFGHDALDFIRRFNVQYAVLSAGAINGPIGFMLHDIQEAGLSQEAAKRAQTKIVLADSAKFDRRAPITMAQQRNIDILITEAQPSVEITEMLARNDVTLINTSAAQP